MVQEGFTKDNVLERSKTELIDMEMNESSNNWLIK